MSWAVLSSPYPTFPWAMPNGPQGHQQSQGLIGQRSYQAFSDMSTPMPTAIEAAHSWT